MYKKMIQTLWNKWFLFLVKIKNYIIKLRKNFAIKNLQILEGDDKKWEK